MAAPFQLTQHFEITDFLNFPVALEITPFQGQELFLIGQSFHLIHMLACKAWQHFA